MKHIEHIEGLETLEDLARINAMNDYSRWSSWGSPVGLVIFFNGMAVLAILIRYAILMK